MSTKNLSEYNPDFVPDASKLTFGIVVSDWNHEITHTLLKGCYDTLIKHGASPSKIKTIHVPGSYELPKAASWLATHAWKGEKEEILMADAVIVLGCVITGETKHDEYISQAVAQGLMQLNVEEISPFIFGLLTPRNDEQAKDRAGGKHGNKGVEAAVTAIKMGHLRLQLDEEDEHSPVDENWIMDQFLDLDEDENELDDFSVN